MPRVYRSLTKQQNDAANLYADLLNEANARIESINTGIGGALGFSSVLVREYCYLQLRMLCELIALGCLTAHGDIQATQTAKFQTEYAADKIIKKLGELHPNFYPHAVRLKITPHHVHFDRIEHGFLTKSELVDLYHKCGDRLHRGSAKKLLADKKKTQPPNYTDIINWTSKIVTLLSQHHIASFDNLTHFICMAKSESSGGLAQVAIAQSPLPE